MFVEVIRDVLHYELTLKDKSYWGVENIEHVTILCVFTALCNTFYLEVISYTCIVKNYKRRE